MKALVLKEYHRLVVEEVPAPRIPADGVLVRVKACGICGSDVHGMDGSTGRRRPPIIMGHEAAGVIAKTGAQVTGWKPGDRPWRFRKSRLRACRSEWGGGPFRRP